MGITHRALGEIKQRGDEVVIAAVVVVGWTAGRGRGGRCSLRLLLVLRLLLRRRLTRVRSHGAVPRRIRPSGFHRLGSLRLVLPKTQTFSDTALCKPAVVVDRVLVKDLPPGRS